MATATNIEEITTHARALKALREAHGRANPIDQLFWLIGYVCSDVDTLRRENAELRARLDRAEDDGR